MNVFIVLEMQHCWREGMNAFCDSDDCIAVTIAFCACDECFSTGDERVDNARWNFTHTLKASYQQLSNKKRAVTMTLSVVFVKSYVNYGSWTLTYRDIHLTELWVLISSSHLVKCI